MKRRAFLVSLLAAAACSGPQVNYKADFPFASLKRVAVARFEGPVGAAAADLFAHALLSTGAEVVERTRLESVMDEHRLSVTGAVDMRTAAKLGGLVGVDGLIFGSVTQFEPPRSYIVYTGTSAYNPAASAIGSSRTLMETRKIGEASILTSAARVAMTARLVDVRTGSVVWSAHQSYEGFDTDMAMTAISEDFARTLGKLWQKK